MDRGEVSIAFCKEWCETFNKNEDFCSNFVSDGSCLLVTRVTNLIKEAEEKAVARERGRIIEWVSKNTQYRDEDAGGFPHVEADDLSYFIDPTPFRELEGKKSEPPKPDKIKKLEYITDINNEYTPSLRDVIDKVNKIIDKIEGGK